MTRSRWISFAVFGLASAFIWYLTFSTYYSEGLLHAVAGALFALTLSSVAVSALFKFDNDNRVSRYSLLTGGAFLVASFLYNVFVGSWLILDEAKTDIYFTTISSVVVTCMLTYFVVQGWYNSKHARTRTKLNEANYALAGMYAIWAAEHPNEAAKANSFDLIVRLMAETWKDLTVADITDSAKRAAEKDFLL